MKIIKKIDTLSVAKIGGLICGGIYLLAGLVVNLAVFIFSIAVLHVYDFLGLGSSILATMLLAVIAGAVAFLVSAASAWLYNVAAGFVGGIIWTEEEWVKKETKDHSTIPPMHFNAPEKKEEPLERDIF